MFDEPPGSHDICLVCEWQDDNVQLKYPALGGGANNKSLCEYQKMWVDAIPLEVKEKIVAFKKLTFKRDPLWRPLTEVECNPVSVEPTTGQEYFEAAGEDSPLYYWLSDLRHN
jgi:hypothetical protein